MTTTKRAKKTAVLAVGERFWYGGRMVRSVREGSAGAGFGDEAFVSLYSTTQPSGRSFIASVRPAASAPLMNAITSRPWLPRRSFDEH